VRAMRRRLERLARRMPGSETRLVAVENEAEAAQVRREALAAGDMRDLIVIHHHRRPSQDATDATGEPWLGICSAALSGSTPGGRHEPALLARSVWRRAMTNPGARLPRPAQT
jgi:hypothetical protein